MRRPSSHARWYYLAPALLAALLATGSGALASAPSPAAAPAPADAPSPAPEPADPGEADEIGYCGPMDVVFVVDDTGSMGGAIASVQAGITQIVQDIDVASGNDYQLGLITLRSQSSWGDEVNVIETLNAGNGPTIVSQVSGLTAGGGNNVPEISDEAIHTAVAGLAAAGRPQNVDFPYQWRSGALRLVIVITDAPPAGMDDNYTPGVDDVNAHNIALMAAADNIKIASIYVPTWSVQPTIQTIMQDYASTTGGVYKETTADGSGTATAIQDILAECGGGESDIWISDNWSDDSSEPNPNTTVWQSPDIKVCTGTSGCATSQNPVAGAPNQVFVTLRNNGYRVPYAPGSGQVHLYYTNMGGAAVWDPTWTAPNPVSGNWNYLGSASATVGASPVDVMIPWSPPYAGHFCLLARWDSPSDPMTFAEGSYTYGNTINNNNIAWRNVNAVHCQPGHTVPRPFRIVPLEPGVPARLTFEAEGGMHGGGPVRVAVDLGDELFQKWLEAGEPGQGFEHAGGTVLNIVNPEDAFIGGLVVDDKGDEVNQGATVTLLFEQEGETNEPGFLRVVQRDDNDDGVDVGGVEFQIHPHLSNEPPAAVALTVDRLAGPSPTLAWAHAIQNRAYEIWRSPVASFKPGSGCSNLVKTVSVPADHDDAQALTFVDEQVGQSEPYYYLVRSVNKFGKVLSNVASDPLPENAPPSAPQCP